MITIQYESKTYNCKEYDFKKGEYITVNDMVLKEDEIQAFFLPLKEYHELKKFKEVIKKQKAEVKQTKIEEVATNEIINKRGDE